VEIDELYIEIQANIDEFLSHTKTWFHPRDIWTEYNIKSEEGKRIVRVVLEDKVVNGELQHEGLKYRAYNRDLREINWFDADETDYIRMNLPFGLNRYIKLFSGVVVIAGETGMGKSAWIMDCIFRNLSFNRPQYLFVNDAKDSELKERIIALCEKNDCALPSSDQLVVYERFDKFGDVIVRDGLNYVDYLDVNAEFYSIGQEIDDIFRATGNGLTFIALQKNPKEAIGVGGIYSIKRSQVYIVLSESEDEVWFGQLLLKKTRGKVNKTLDPTGWKWGYDIQNGVKFVVQVR